MHSLARNVRLLVRAAAVAFALLSLVTVSMPLGAQQAPAAPINLSFAVAGSTVTLSWQPGSGGGAPSGYQLEVGSAPGASNLMVIQTRSAGMVANVVPNGVYFVRARAINASGMSNPSNEITVRVGCAPLAAGPAGFTARVNGNLVTLSWETVAGATAYHVEVGSGPGLANLAFLPTTAPSVVAMAPPGTYHARVRAVSACGTSMSSQEVVIQVGVTQTAGRPIWGAVDPSILGTCTVAAHDRFVVDGGDGYRYRTWHPQTDPATGCVFGHEHGDDPSTQTNASIRAQNVRFGYIGRRHPMPSEPLGHEEPHEGFKVFVANRGQRNNEGRTHLHDSRVVFHMGTGGPRRFTMQHHSMEHLIATNDGRYMFLQAMADTGGVATICAEPRAGKTVVAIDPRCRLGSPYEIWQDKLTVRSGRRVIAQTVASTAVFDPITVLDPSNPSRLVYIWDEVMDPIMIHNDNRDGARGCAREVYHGPTFWYNRTDRTVFYTDAMGNEVPATDPLALTQIVSRHETFGTFVATNDRHSTFKHVSRHCGQRSRLGIKN